MTTNFYQSSNPEPGDAKNPYSYADLVCMQQAAVRAQSTGTTQAVILPSGAGFTIAPLDNRCNPTLSG